MKVEINTSSYNEKRYGKPYISCVDFSDPKGIPTWGDWVGQAGDAGLLTIDAYPGDIIMRGQKDNRNPKYSAPSYGQVNESGGIDWLDTKAEAYKAWQAAQGKPAINQLDEMLSIMQKLVGFYTCEDTHLPRGYECSTRPYYGPKDEEIIAAWEAARAAIAKATGE